MLIFSNLCHNHYFDGSISLSMQWMQSRRLSNSLTETAHLGIFFLVNENAYPKGSAIRNVTTGTMFRKAQAKVADVYSTPIRNKYWVTDALWDFKHGTKYYINRFSTICTLPESREKHMNLCTNTCAYPTIAHKKRWHRMRGVSFGLEFLQENSLLAQETRKLL